MRLSLLLVLAGMAGGWLAARQPEQAAVRAEVRDD
jgi:hypothetical protein